MYLFYRIPEPKPPPVSIMSNIASESLVIAIIAYIISVSMAMIFAQKNKYEIKANQEFLAQVNWKATARTYLNASKFSFS